MDKKNKAIAPAALKGTILKGKVVSDKMDKTIVVEVTRFVKNAKYGKFFKVTKRYKAHDAEEKHTIGEEVEIQECRPMSKDKHHVVLG